MEATKKTVEEWVEFLAERYDGTPFESKEYWSWINAAYPFGDEDEEATASAWEESLIDSVLKDFNSNDFEAIGKRDAGSLSNEELAQTGYENPNCNGTPWSDGEPKEAQWFVRYADELTSSDVIDKIEEAVNEATDAYNSGYIDAVAGAIEEIARDRAAHLARADATGWRICRFGLPGSSTHVVRIAEPGAADEISAEIFQPGPIGPYDSTIMTPTEADAQFWQDGNPIYRDEVDSILSQVE